MHSLQATANNPQVNLIYLSKVHRTSRSWNPLPQHALSRPFRTCSKKVNNLFTSSRYTAFRKHRLVFHGYLNDSMFYFFLPILYLMQSLLTLSGIEDMEHPCKKLTCRPFEIRSKTLYNICLPPATYSIAKKLQPRATRTLSFTDERPTYAFLTNGPKPSLAIFVQIGALDLGRNVYRNR